MTIVESRILRNRLVLKVFSAVEPPQRPANRHVRGSRVATSVVVPCRTSEVFHPLKPETPISICISISILSLLSPPPPSFTSTTCDTSAFYCLFCFCFQHCLSTGPDDQPTFLAILSFAQPPLKRWPSADDLSQNLYSFTCILTKPSSTSQNQQNNRSLGIALIWLDLFLILLPVPRTSIKIRLDKDLV